MWHIKFLGISSELWICRSHSIWWKLDFCQLCNLTAGCNFNNQLLFTVFCSTSVGWIKTNWVIYIPIVFCPLTVYISKHIVISLVLALSYTVSGQNTIGIYITPLVLIQPTDVEQNAVNNNWLLKLQPAVKLQSWQKSNFHQIEWDLQIHNPDEILRSLICHNIYFYVKIKIFINVLFNYNAMLKKLFLTKSVKCDISNFSEFHQEYESAGLILIWKNWIFTNFVA